MDGLRSETTRYMKQRQKKHSILEDVRSVNYSYTFAYKEYRKSLYITVTAVTMNTTRKAITVVENVRRPEKNYWKAILRLCHTVPVSYTHLDVYKRQIVWLVAVGFLTILNFNVSIRLVRVRSRKLIELSRSVSKVN